LTTSNGWNIGLLICYDVEFPEAVRELALAGADLVLVPTALMQAYSRIPEVLLPARAYESQLYLAYANYCGNEQQLTYCGNSLIVSPTGEIRARGGRQTTLLIADIFASDLSASRKLNTYIDDRRPQLYGHIARTSSER
jgi:predicted amidohydrolase